MATLHSHKPATPERFLCFQLIKISEFPQPSVTQCVWEACVLPRGACVFPCRAAVLSGFLSHKPKAYSKAGNNPSWDKFLWINIDMLLANILYALCLFLEDSWTSVGGGKFSGSLVWLPLWWGSVYSISLGQMWPSGKMLTFPRVVFPWTFWIAPSCVALPFYSSSTGELGQKELSQNLCERNWFFLKDFVPTECSSILSRCLQGFRELSYLKVPSFPELLVYGLIGCQHDEAWDHEIESGQSKKECDIVSGKGEEGRKKGC